ncbi:hydroxysteroid 11-beta-dehydrogenase 1-like protein [Lingula anatina]|uniref:Hydroxysteroid 11-beta-dehydrogenase 1-like protein n=1 Tax=Lingula anatina TaxID=7574 RepID=A0A1S3JLQ2_LINAN|nr:hydroxysteroid 11-beta-dehydrogenase 1-like protein [Lingula anatina]|eukprot:XP_013411056.1 hydroxysteroid 11-beta-dehydrogenase 1-like protein [Lingula anatina]
MGLKFTLMTLAFSAVIIAYYIAMQDVDDFDPADVKGKNVLITGASTGIGEQMAYHFAKMGANLVLTARREHLLKKVVLGCKKLSPNSNAKYAYLVSDMGNMGNTEKVIQFTEQSLGGLDILMLNHALLAKREAWLGTRENLTKLATTMDVNFRSYVHLASHALPLLTNSSGRIGVVSSMAGHVAFPYMSWYTTAKYALQGFFGVLRQELKLKHSNISVTLSIVGLARTDNAVEGLNSLLGAKASSAHMFDPRDVAMEIIQATVTRQYEIYTGVPVSSRIYIFIRTLFPKLADDLMRKNFT